MSTELWMAGAIIEFIEGIPCNRAILRATGKNQLILANIENGKEFRLDKKEIENIHERGGLKFLAESRDFGELRFLDLSDKEQRETNRRYQYIKRLQEKLVRKVTKKRAEKIIMEVAAELGETPPHWQSVRSWNAMFLEAGGKIRGLYPKHRLKGAREPKICSKVLGIIRGEEKRYYQKNQPSMASIHRNVEEKIIAHNLDNPEEMLRPPNYLTVRSYVLERTYQRKLKSRIGEQALRVELSSAKSGIITTRVLERIEIDHTQLDIHVLHDDHKTLLGRPFITVLIDHFSHMVLGFQISFENPSFASVSMACLNAFLPKENFLRELGCDSTWPAHGIPSTLVTDNGNEFWGKNFMAVCDEIGAVFQYCPIRRANYKARVERFFGIVNSMVLDDLPGVVRKPGKSGEGYDARQEAKITFTEFKRYFVNWLTGVFHNLPISDRGKTPNQLWLESERDYPIPIEDEMDLTTMLMATTTRSLSKGGIEIFTMSYNSSVLKDLYRRDGPQEVKIKYDPFDLGFILVLDEKSKIYIRVDCDDYVYAKSLSAFEHERIKSIVRAEGKSKLKNIDLQKARVKLSRERDELHARNRRRRTQVTTSKAARAEKIGVPESIIPNYVHETKIKDYFDEDVDLTTDGWSVE